MSDYFERVEAHLLDAVEHRAGREGRPAHRRGGWSRWRSWWMALAGSMAAAGVALVFVLSASTGPPAAYAVIVRADGSVSLTLNELVGVDAANARLAELGVRARLVKREPGCSTHAKPVLGLWPAGLHRQSARSPVRDHETPQMKQVKRAQATVAQLRVLPKIVEPARSSRGVRLIIHPNAIPHALTLLLVFRRVGPRAVGGTIALYRDPAPACLPTM